MAIHDTLRKRFHQITRSECNSDHYSTVASDFLSRPLACIGLVAVVICCCSTALGQQPWPEPQELDRAALFGRWIAESPGPDAITRLEIDLSPHKFLVQVWVACKPGDECKWSPITVDAQAVTRGDLSFILPGRHDRMHISLLPDRRLRVLWRTKYFDQRPEQQRTQDFMWLSPPHSDFSSPGFPQTLWQTVSSSVVVFSAKQATGQSALIGSGLLVKQGLVATSHTVVKNAVQLQARLAAQSALWPVGEVVKVDEAHDLAIVKVEGLRGWPLSLSDRSVPVTDEVFVITNATDGTISSVTVKLSVLNGGPHIEITTPVSPFESGMPVFNKYGQTIGLSTSNPEDAKKPGLVIPARYLIALLPNVAENVAQPRPPATAVDSQPVMLNSPQPRYTDEARLRKVSGAVTLRVLVGADGSVKEAIVISGLPYGLDEQAIQAVYQARFKPAMKDGRPVEFWFRIVIEFKTT
jgi:TonB family protein